MAGDPHIQKCGECQRAIGKMLQGADGVVAVVIRVRHNKDWHETTITGADLARFHQMEGPSCLDTPDLEQ